MVMEFCRKKELASRRQLKEDFKRFDKDRDGRFSDSEKENWVKNEICRAERKATPRQHWRYQEKNQEGKVNQLT